MFDMGEKLDYRVRAETDAYAYSTLITLGYLVGLLSIFFFYKVLELEGVDVAYAITISAMVIGVGGYLFLRKSLRKDYKKEVLYLPTRYEKLTGEDINEIFDKERRQLSDYLIKKMDNNERIEKESRQQITTLISYINEKYELLDKVSELKLDGKTNKEIIDELYNLEEDTLYKFDDTNHIMDKYELIDKISELKSTGKIKKEIWSDLYDLQEKILGEIVEVVEEWGEAIGGGEVEDELFTKIDNKKWDLIDQITIITTEMYELNTKNIK